MTISQLKEIPTPASISWIPQTPAWYVVAILLLILIGWLIFRTVRVYRHNRYRRAALAELEKIRLTVATNSSAVAALPELVKRVALQLAPRSSVAPISGEAWLGFLDRSYKGTGFTAGPGKLLPVIAYRGASGITSEQAASLMDLIATWIRRHHAGV